LIGSLVVGLRALTFQRFALVQDAQDITPTLEELSIFQEKKQTEAATPAEMHVPFVRPRKKITFAKGDAVEVTTGDLQYLMGEVVSVEGENVIIAPKHKDLVCAIHTHTHTHRERERERET
jgi:transcription antitermination factor NusG